MSRQEDFIEAGIAIAAMDIVNGAYNIHNDMERLVRHSVKLADALIAELQKKGGQDGNT